MVNELFTSDWIILAKALVLMRNLLFICVACDKHTYDSGKQEIRKMHVKQLLYEFAAKYCHTLDYGPMGFMPSSCTTS